MEIETEILKLSPFRSYCPLLQITPPFLEVVRIVLIRKAPAKKFRKDSVADINLACKSCGHLLKNLINDPLKKLAKLKAVVKIILFKARVPVQIHRRPDTNIPYRIPEHEEFAMVPCHSDIFLPPNPDDLLDISWLPPGERTVDTKGDRREGSSVDKRPEVFRVPDPGGPGRHGKRGGADLFGNGADQIEEGKLAFCYSGYPGSGGEGADAFPRRLMWESFKVSFHGLSFRGLPPFRPFSRLEAAFLSDFTRPMAAAAETQVSSIIFPWYISITACFHRFFPSTTLPSAFKRSTSVLTLLNLIFPIFFLLFLGFVSMLIIIYILTLGLSSIISIKKRKIVFSQQKQLDIGETMKGRKSIPSKIINLRGGTAHTHQPPRNQEPQPPEKMPSCPKFLDAGARKEWRRTGKILQSVGLMTELDRATLAGYCDAYSQWEEATKKVHELGMVFKKSDGTPGLNPYLRVAREAFERMMKNAVLIGMSPSSRASLKVEKPKPKSKVQGFMERKNGAKEA